ncbi:MAG TPA: hypothetical protein VMU39_13455 [Solirubrobacteraceae bacterium]|nr:hypothetical protein [Solirubrobacteraceae bacterium]
MRRTIRTRWLTASAVAAIALTGVTAATASAASTTSAVVRTFSFIAKPSSKTALLINIDQFQMNARCSPGGAPIIFGFSTASVGDVFGRILDGLGRLHSVHNTSFNHASKGILFSTSSGDYDSTGTVLFESGIGKVVTVQYAFDNSTTLNKQNVCTVFGSYTAT